MWFGTDIGLNKYDGYKFTVYKHSPVDTTSIGVNFIASILEDSHGILWVGGGYEGIDIFDRQKQVFTHFKHKNNDSSSISNNVIRDIFEDSYGNLWIGTAGGGLNLFNRKNQTFSHILHDPQDSNSIGSNFICSIAEDSHGILWFGSTEGILIRYDPVKKIFINFKVHKGYKGDLFNTNFGSVYVDSKDNIWFGTEIGLFIYDQDSNTFTHYEHNNTYNCLSSNSISSVLEMKENIFLIATDHGGLNILNRKTGKFSNLKNNKLNSNTLSNDQLYSIYKSDDGIIWIGCYHGGINIYDSKATKFRQNKFSKGSDISRVNNRSITSIATDKEDNIWLGYDGQGVDIYNPSTNNINRFNPGKKYADFFNNLAVVDIYIDENDNTWIGTYMKGLWYYSNNNNEIRQLQNIPGNPISLSGNNTWAILKIKDTLLVGIMGEGLDMINLSDNSIRHFSNDPKNPESISNNNIYRIFKDNRDNIWIGTRLGINLFDKKKGTFKCYNSSPGNKHTLYGNWVMDIYQDSSNNLWVGTDIALNLYEPDSDKFVHYLENLDAPGSAIQSILEDNDHNLWLGTNSGLIKYNTSKKTYWIYDVSDGLQNNEFNNKAAFKDRNGKMFFGNRNGLTVFYPDSIRDNTRIPPVFITDFKIFNKSVLPGTDGSVLKKDIQYTKEIDLSYKQSVITFEFAALNYTNSSKNQYAYKLEGFDNAWNDAKARRSATYTNLNPGRYIFHVKGSNNSGIWNETGTSVIINVSPPIWKTLWFYGLELLLVASIIYLFIYFREKRLIYDKKLLQKKVFERTLKIEQQKEELEQHRNHLEKLVESRTKELKIAKEKAEESDRLKSAFLANMSHEIRTPMNAIVGFSNLLDNPQMSAEERSELISYINTNTESLLVLIEDILDLSLIEANQIRIEEKSFSINQLLESVYSSILMNNNNEHVAVKLNNTLKDQYLVLKSDQYRIKQILTNLMNNALKFTEKGFVELGLLKKEDRLVFYVKDTGIGISEDEKENIFERFRKVGRKSSYDRRGAGLGLAISKSLSEILNGELSVESTSDSGSIFHFSLPFKAVSAGEKSSATDMVDIAAINWSNYNILIAEDEKTNFLFLEKALKKTGASITWAQNGKEAVHLVNRLQNFDLILMDIKMPEMDGYEAAKIIKSRFPNQVIIAQSAYAKPEDGEDNHKKGFDDYLAKPIKPVTLYYILNKYL